MKIFPNLDFFILNLELNSGILVETILIAPPVVVNGPVFLLKKMGDFEKTEIYAGKKTEVILIDQSMVISIQDKFIIFLNIYREMPDYS